MKQTYRERGQAGMGSSPLVHHLTIKGIGTGEAFGAKGIGWVRFVCSGGRVAREHVLTFESPADMYALAERLRAQAVRWADSEQRANRRAIGSGPRPPRKGDRL